MVKSYAKIVAASVLISAAVPANAMWRSFASRLRGWSNVKKTTVLAGSSLLTYRLYASNVERQSEHKKPRFKNMRTKWSEIEPQTEYLGNGWYAINGQFVQMSEEMEYNFFSDEKKYGDIF